jgi:hopanoid biosynthesis associated RND transporter like protein HpnN
VRVEAPTAWALGHGVRLATARPILTIVVSLVLAAVGVAYTRHALKFQTSSAELLPPDRPYVQQFKRYLGDFGELNDIVVVVQAPRVDQATSFARRVAEDLRRPPVSATRVTYRIDPDRFAGRALLYLSTEQLAKLQQQVLDHREFIETYAAEPGLSTLVEAINHEIARRFATRFVDLGLGESERVDPGFVDSLLGAITVRLEANETMPSAWSTMFGGGGDDETAGYFLSGDKRLLFILVEPRRVAGNFTDNQELIAAIRRTVAGLRAEFPGVEAGVTGTPALSNDEMLTAFQDSRVGSALASALTLAAVLLVCRRVVKSLLMFAVLVVSLAWALGLITLIVGQLTIFSVMFISLLVGLGIDYGIYFFFRYEEERALGGTIRASLEATARRTGPGILFAALTAAGTFGVLALTEFRGIQEFGIVGGLSILTAFVAMLTLLPALLVLLDRRARGGAGHSPPAGARLGSPLLERLTRRSWAILPVTVLLTVYSLWALPGVAFDYDRLNLQAKGTESVIWERKIMESRRSAFPALASAGSLDELRRKQEAFAGLASVSDVISVLKVVPRQQDEKLATIATLEPVVAPIRFGASSDVDPGRLRAALTALSRWLELALREASGDGPPPALVSAHARTQALLGVLQRADPGLVRRLARVQEELQADFIAKFRKFQANLNPTAVSITDLPDELRRKFVGHSGAFLMQIYPAVNSWTREGMQQFVAELRAIDPAVTGSPVISYEASRLMEKAYLQGTLYATILVSALAAVMLRRVRDTLLSLVPLVLGTLWTVGVMHMCGLSFNLANVWGVPLIIGAASEFGLNVALRGQEAAVDGGPALARSTVLAVLLNGITTTAGFGSLMIAGHQGIFGLGLLLTIGSIASLAAALVVLPALLRLFGPARAVAAALVVVPVLLVGGSASAGEPTEQIRAAIERTYQVLTQSPPSTTQRGERDAAAEQAMDRLFDWTAMAQRSLQRHWEPRTPAERVEFTRLFSELFGRAYVTRISLVDATKFQYLGDTVIDTRATVRTRVTTKRGSVIDVDYLTRVDEARRWRVIDVQVQGISLIDNYARQFDTVITSSSYQALVNRLKDRARQAR